MKMYPIITLLFLLVPTFCVSAVMTVVYPKQGKKDDATGYPVELLRLAIERAGVEEKLFLQPSSIEVKQSRVLKLIEQDVVIDIAWSMTNKSREENLHAIKIPLYKGLYGFRILLIHQDNENMFELPVPLNVLQQEMVGVQGHDWPDLKILNDNGFNVASTPSYSGLFEMLSRKRVDYFPRSVLEAWQEETDFTSYQITTEKHILLYYPTAIYFFVNKNKTELAQIIYRGLSKAQKDGSFDLLFESVLEDHLVRAKLGKRVIYSLRNEEFTESDKHLLTQPEDWIKHPQ